MTKDITVILLSGGKGSRFQSNVAKQYHTLKGKPLALYSLEKFLQMQNITEIVVVAELSYQHLFLKIDKKISFALPGLTRHGSSFNGFQKISNKHGIVLIHDAARPLFSIPDVVNLVETAREFGAAALATPATSTIKQVDQDNCVVKTLNRNELWEMQTPQAFQYHILAKGFAEYAKNPIEVTDDLSLVEPFYSNVKIVRGSSKNIKITNPEDLKIAEALL